MDPWNWMPKSGDAATWASAIGTFLAFMAVVVTYIVDKRAARRQLIHAQAQSVAAWFEGLPRRDPVVVEGRVAEVSVILRNMSQLPVYEVVLDYRKDLSVLRLKHGDAVTEEMQRDRLVVELLPPGEWVVQRRVTPAWHDGSLAIRFVDSANRCWERTSNLQLRRLHRPPMESFGIDPSHHAREQIIPRALT